MKSPIRILLADDHPSLRAGLAAILNSQPDLKVVAEAGSGREVMASGEKADLTSWTSACRTATASRPSRT